MDHFQSAIKSLKEYLIREANNPYRFCVNWYIREHFCPPFSNSEHSLLPHHVSPIWDTDKDVLIRHKSTTCVFPDLENKYAEKSTRLQCIERNFEKKISDRKDQLEREGWEEIFKLEFPNAGIIDDNFNYDRPQSEPYKFCPADQEHKKTKKMAKAIKGQKQKRPTTEPPVPKNWVHPSRDKGVSYSMELAKAKLNAKALKKKQKGASGALMNDTPRAYEPPKRHVIRSSYAYRPPKKEKEFVPRLPIPPCDHAWPMPPEYEFDKPNLSKKRASRYVTIRIVPKTRPATAPEIKEEDKWNIHAPKKSFLTRAQQSTKRGDELNGPSKASQFQSKTKTKKSRPGALKNPGSKIPFTGISVGPITVPRASTATTLIRTKPIPTRNIQSAGPSSNPAKKLFEIQTLKAGELKRISSHFFGMKSPRTELINYLAESKTRTPKLKPNIKKSIARTDIPKSKYTPPKLDFDNADPPAPKNEYTFTGLRPEFVQNMLSAKFDTAKAVKPNSTKATGLAQKKKLTPPTVVATKRAKQPTGTSKPEVGRPVRTKPKKQAQKPKKLEAKQPEYEMPSVPFDQDFEDKPAPAPIEVVKTRSEELREKFRNIIKNGYVGPYVQTPYPYGQYDNM